MHLDVIHPEPSCGPSFPTRTHNWAGEQRAIVGYKTNSLWDSLQRFFTVGAGHIPLSCTDAWKGALNFHGNRLHSADSGSLSLSGYVCHPWCSEFQGQQCVMDKDWSGVVLGSGILVKGMYCKHTGRGTVKFWWQRRILQSGADISCNRILLVELLSGY